jgi:hypothetical protein
LPDLAGDSRIPVKVALRGHTYETAAMMLSKLYAGFLVLASIIVMAAVGMMILVVITDVAHLATTQASIGMNP